MEQRLPFVKEMKKQLPDAILVKGGVYENRYTDNHNTYRRALKASGGLPTIMMQDDLILCEGFREKAINEIAQRPGDVIQFFSMRGADLTVGSRYEAGGKFNCNPCVYFPEKMTADLYSYFVENEKRFPYDKYGTDCVVREYLKERKLKYFIVIPNLVDHAVAVSMIDKRRSSKRQSKTFQK